jgi:hypothetical protein
VSTVPKTNALDKVNLHLGSFSRLSHSCVESAMVISFVLLAAPTPQQCLAPIEDSSYLQDRPVIQINFSNIRTAESYGS